MMAGFFATASSQYLNNSAPPVTDYPLTVGCWVNLLAVANVNRTVFCLSDTGTSNNQLTISMLTTEILEIQANAGSLSVAPVTTALTAGTWNYVIGRFISATNRRIAVLFSSGSIEHAQNTTSRAPTGLDTMSIGARVDSGGAQRFWDGRLAEFFVANADIQADGAQTQDALVRQLAYGGPFSVPHIASALMDYQSLLKGPLPENGEQAFIGPKGRQTWVNTNGVTMAPHPPLAYGYELPRPRSTQAMI